MPLRPVLQGLEFSYRLGQLRLAGAIPVAVAPQLVALQSVHRPHSILKLALAKAVRLYVSPPVLAEYEELLLRKSYPLDRRRAKMMLNQVQSVGIIGNPAAGEPLTSDPDDSIFLECARAAKADYLVTGNTNHSPVHSTVGGT